jgi:hypothetical protein
VLFRHLFYDAMPEQHGDLIGEDLLSIVLIEAKDPEGSGLISLLLASQYCDLKWEALATTDACI